MASRSSSARTVSLSLATTRRPLGLKSLRNGMARRVATTLTRSPRTVVLAAGPAPAIPTGWHTVTFRGVSFAARRSWPIKRTRDSFGIGHPCSTPGVALRGPQVTLSTDRQVAMYACPVGLPTPQTPQGGVQVDAGRKGVVLPGTLYSTHCLDLHGLTACPASWPPYSILVLKVTVPGRKTPVLVSIGLAGNGMTARTVLYSLRAT